MLRQQNDLLLPLGLSLVALVVVLTGIFPSFLQVILEIPFLLFVPGNALLCAILPGFTHSRLERLLFAMGISLGLLVIVGLILNFTPWGLHVTTWSLTLFFASTVFTVIAIWRRNKASVSKPAPVKLYLPPRQVIFLSLSAVVIIFSVVFAFYPKPAMGIQGYTSLWVTPGSAAQENTVQIGIHSQELELTQYTLIVSHNDQLLKQWSDIYLEPGGTWQESLPMAIGNGRLEALLYRADHPGQVYRRVSLETNSVGMVK